MPKMELNIDVDEICKHLKEESYEYQGYFLNRFCEPKHTPLNHRCKNLIKYLNKDSARFIHALSEELKKSEETK